MSDESMGLLLAISKQLRRLQLSDFKSLPFEFQHVWIEYFAKVCEHFPPFEYLNLKAFSDELEHGRQALTSMLQN